MKINNGDFAGGRTCFPWADEPDGDFANDPRQVRCEFGLGECCGSLQTLCKVVSDLGGMKKGKRDIRTNRKTTCSIGKVAEHSLVGTYQYSAGR